MRVASLWLLVGGLAGGATLGVACATSGQATPADILDGGGGPDAKKTGPGSSGEGGGTGPGADGAAGVDAGCPAPAPLGVELFTDTCKAGSPPSVDWSPIRRISRVEYDNMVRDLLYDTTQPATSFVPESPLANGVNFQSNTYSSVGGTLVPTQYQQAAETLAQTAVSNSATLAKILPCTTQDAACATQFISTWANRAFRGQLDATESAALLSIYTTIEGMFDFPTGIQAIITSVLESPRFLYVLEFGDSSGSGGTGTGAVTALTSYEVAARLSLFLWRSVPDATLMSAASAGSLSTAAEVEAQAVRMLADPKALGAIEDFTTQWVELQSTPTLGKDTQFKAWTTNIGEEMMDETLMNVSQLVLTANGGLTELLTSGSSYINPQLATFYGVTSPAGGTSVTVTDPALPSGQTVFTSTPIPNRSGILTNGSIMATQAHTTLPSSVLRGKLVREDILCDPIPPPPPNVPPAPTTVPDGGTTRDLFEAHEKISGCVGCHQFMDPIGFGFGNFDATGAWQTTDANGFTGTFPAIDATGQVIQFNPGELSITAFNGATQLTTDLAASTQVSQCFALQELRYALLRIETPDDACSASQIYTAFTGSNLNIQKLLLAIVQTDAFRYRSTVVAGGTCQAGSPCQ